LGVNLNFTSSFCQNTVRLKLKGRAFGQPWSWSTIVFPRCRDLPAGQAWSCRIGQRGEDGWMLAYVVQGWFHMCRRGASGATLAQLPRTECKIGQSACPTSSVTLSLTHTCAQITNAVTPDAVRYPQIGHLCVCAHRNMRGRACKIAKP